MSSNKSTEQVNTFKKPPKGYCISRVDALEGNELHYKDYLETAKPAIENYGARFIGRGGNIVQAKGRSRQRNIIIEFESLGVAKACY